MILFLSIISVIINLANSYIVARFARKMFATTLAGSFLFSCLAIGIIIDSSFGTEITTTVYFLTPIVVFALLILILANPLRYLIAYGFVFLLLITLLLPFDLPNLIKDSNMIALILVLLPIIPVVSFRKQIRYLTIGLSSGGSLGFGLISLLNLLVDPTEGILLLDAILYFTSVAFGVYFQFKLYDNFFGSSEHKAMEQTS